MTRYQSDEIDATEVMDHAFYQESGRMTAGASAFHQASPFDLVAAMEEEGGEDWQASRIEHERHALRNEVMAGLLDYLFADGPLPEMVRSRAEGYLRAYAPASAAMVMGPKEWVGRAAVEAVLRRNRWKLREEAGAATSRGALADWHDELDREEDRGTVQRTLSALAELLVSQGKTWRAVVATALALAKLYRPEFVGGMSLEARAARSGDAGRGTPSARARRIHNERIEAAGFSASSVHFQKSAGTVEKYRAAAMGNSNRSKGRRVRR
jgi:hypothetical protein